MENAEQTLETLGGIALGAIFEDYENAPPLNAVEDTASGKLVEVDAPAGDTRVAVEQPRGADGKFIPKESPEGYTEVTEGTVGEAEEAAAPAPEPEAEGQPEGTGETPDSDDALVLELDEDVIDFIETKYGGDIAKALKGAKEAQALIGRQGTELGDTRAENELYREMVERLAVMEARLTPWQNDVDEDPSALAQEMVQRAADTGDITILDNPMYMQAIESWGEEEPFKAAQFAAQVNMARLAAAQTLGQQPEPPTTIESEIEALKGRYPDLTQRLPAMQAAAEKRPALARLLNDGDARARAEALEDLYHLAGGAGTPDTSAAARQIILRAKAEADAAKDDAAVVSATNTAPPPAPPASGDDALKAALQEHLGLGDDFKIVG